MLRGSEPSQSVLLGAHRDAWVYGVGDNGAGTITLLEAARGLGYLAKSGWRPKRTIVVALWDGEEIGLRGSAAYASAHGVELHRGCVAYLNADLNISGATFASEAVGGLGPAVVEATRAVQDPARYRTTVYDRWHAQRGGVGVSETGGGSDHESFLFAFGTPVAEMSFKGPFGPYHSSYDTLRYATTWSDPGFALHRTAAQLYGVLAMRLANADALPYSFAAYVPALRAGVDRLQARAKADGRSLESAPLLQRDRRVHHRGAPRRRSDRARRRTRRRTRARRGAGARRAVVRRRRLRQRRVSRGHESVCERLGERAERRALERARRGRRRDEEPALASGRSALSARCGAETGG